MDDFITGYLDSLDSQLMKAVVLLVLYIIAAKIADLFTGKALKRLAAAEACRLHGIPR